MRAGDVVTLDFPGVTGIKRRPAVIVSSDLYHQERPDVIVGLITSQILHAAAATDYVLQDWQAAGLRKPSAFRAFFATLPSSAIISQVGRLSDTDWEAVRERVNISLA